MTKYLKKRETQERIICYRDCFNIFKIILYAIFFNERISSFKHKIRSQADILYSDVSIEYFIKKKRKRFHSFKRSF